MEYTTGIIKHESPLIQPIGAPRLDQDSSMGVGNTVQIVLHKQLGHIGNKTHHHFDKYIHLYSELLIWVCYHAISNRLSIGSCTYGIQHRLDRGRSG